MTDTEFDRRRPAALNNAEWCDAVCRTHGLSGRVLPTAWIQPRIGPPYYSNMVTLSPAVDEQLTAVGELKTALPGGFSIKDSFAVLDLTAQGFRPLFDAEWIWLDPRKMVAQPAEDWAPIRTEVELIEWEAAWAADGSPTTTRVFYPALLEDERFALFAAREAGRIVAGCAANRSAEVVGISNFFAPQDRRQICLAAAVATVARFATGHPLVGYERDDGPLAGMKSLGFDGIGPLRVWLWDGAV